MEYNNYEAAINALLVEYEGVLPDLAMEVPVVLVGFYAHLTVAELLALALTELSNEEFAIETVKTEPVLSEVAVVAAPKVKIPTELLTYTGPVVLDKLVEWATAAVN